MKRLIWWIRRDFRLNDNTALFAALSDADEVIPVFILDDKLLRSPRVQGPRVAWMLEGLQALDNELREHHSSLVLRRGAPHKELLILCRESKSSGVYFNRDYSRYAVKRDQIVANTLQAEGIRVEAFKDVVLHEADEVKSKQDKPYAVYSMYRKAWEALPKPESVDIAPLLKKLTTIPELQSVPLPLSVELGSTPISRPIAVPGEQHGLAQLENFVNRSIYEYAEQRNILAVNGTSLLSPYLRWGMISPRTCYWYAQAALDASRDEAERHSVRTWQSELIWREFCYQNLAINPGAVRNNFRPEYNRIQWQNKREWLQAWTLGKTGYPIVDAAMRQLTATGWMHNRARMIVASFLCKDLLIDWRLGELVFMQRLLDGDVANNVGGWQWTAGTGLDAAPYFRIFNPTTQAERFDPEGVYVRHWLPELGRVPVQFIHQPWTMTSDQQKQYGCLIGKNYPVPIVNHEQQREQALALYSATSS